MSDNVVFDFDGVIHSYVSGWKGTTVIPDPPVAGIADCIRNLRSKGYKVIVQSTRCSIQAGRDAVEAYLKENGIVVDGVVAEKPPAIVYVDDRAICFDGHPESLLKKITTFKPWNKTHRFQECNVFGKKCLFCIDRINRDEYPSFERYELMHDNSGTPTAIQTDVMADFYGTVLSKLSLIDHTSRNYYASNGNLGVNFKKGDIDITNNFMTIEEFLEGSNESE
jgi:hypothetical protein